MTTLAEHIIIAGAENRPLMLEKSMYDSWASRIYLFIKGKKNGRMMLDSIDNGPLVYPTVKENGQTRPKKYSELTEAQLQDDCDFAYVHGEALYEYYWRFSQLINDIHTIGMTMQQVQVNTKFLNALPPEWSKFITDAKLPKSFYTTNYDQLYAYLSQHERNANEVRIMRERYPYPLALVANSETLYNLSQSLQHLGEDPIDCINKEMAFLSAVASRFPPSNNQLRTSSNPKIQATIQDGRVTVQQILDEEQLTFIADPRVAEVQVAQQKIPHNLAFQTEDLDAYDSDCDDISSVNAILMANLSSYDPDVLSEVPYSDSYSNDMINQDVQEMPYSEQTHIDDYPDNEINSDSNIIPYSQYLQESQDAANLDKENQTNKMVNESLTVELERYKERVFIFEQILNVDLNKREKLIDSRMDDLIRNRNAKFAAFQQEIDTLKETLSNHIKEKESLSKTLTVFKTESKEKESKYIDREIVLEKQNKELENIISIGYQNPFNLKKAQRIKPTLYDGSVIAKQHAVISIIDDEETLILEEQSRSKILDKQNDPISIEKKIKISPIDYSKLNQIKEDFGKRFVTKKELPAEQAFWLKHSSISETPVTSHTPVRIEAPSELPKSVENSDLNAQLQEKIFAIAALKNELRKLKGKNIVDTVISKPSVTIAPGMFKLDIKPISHRLKNNRDAHEVNLEKTIENTDILRGLVECARKQNPSEPFLESACMFIKHV
ncbi:hypothetical protein Tco_0206520 [Tanacetum coccineum]